MDTSSPDDQTRHPLESIRSIIVALIPNLSGFQNIDYVSLFSKSFNLWHSDFQSLLSLSFPKAVDLSSLFLFLVSLWFQHNRQNFVWPAVNGSLEKRKEGRKERKRKEGKEEAQRRRRRKEGKRVEVSEKIKTRLAIFQGSAKFTTQSNTFVDLEREVLTMIFLSSLSWYTI